MEHLSEQIASGTENVQVLVKESENVSVEINGTRVASFWVPPFRQPLPENVKNRELALLLATTGITDMVGRDDAWQECLKWCADSELNPVSVVCIVGRGGSGKTRFALELVHSLRQMEGWDARFVRFQKSEPLDLWAKTNGSNHVLLVFDYAPDYAASIASSLRLLAETPPKNPKRRLRILLLARTASLGSGWLLPFEPASTIEVGQSPRDLFRHGAELIELSALSPDNQVRVFVQAYGRAAGLLGLPERPVDEAVFQSRHAVETLKDPLSLMMAALVGLQNGLPNALSLNRIQLAKEAAHLLVERRLQVAFSENPAIALHITAYATLTAGLSANKALQALEVESEALHLGHVSDPSNFVTRLAAWFPGEDGDLIGAIEPDILGEAYVLSQLSSRKEKATEVLFRAAKDHPIEVFQSLIRTVQDYCFTADGINVEPLQWLNALIETGHTDNTQLLFEINAAFPESSVVLRKDKLLLREKLNENLFRLAGESGQMDPRAKKWLLLMRAVSLNLLSIAQSDMGLLSEALESAKGSVRLMGELAEHDPLVYDQLLARYVNDLGNRQGEAGQDEEALDSNKRSVELQREIATRDRVELPNLAKSVNNLGVKLRKIGMLDASLDCAEEAVSLYRELVKEDRDEFLPVFAGFLSNLSNSQSAVGQHEAALTSAMESEACLRELAERHRDAYLPDLARALNNLSAMQSAVGQNEEGLASAEEAVRLLRDLTAFDRDVYLLSLSAALNNLAGRQASAGYGGDALANAREASDITRELLSRSHSAFIFDHTKSCGRLGLVLLELGRHAEAADAFADGFREVLPSLEDRPRPPLVRQALLLCAGYLQATEKGGIERDWPLLARAMPILGPHLKESGDQNDLPR